MEPVQPRDHFALFVEESSEIGTGVALFKPEAIGDIEFEIHDQEGNNPVGEVLRWGNFRHRALTVPQWFANVDTKFLRDFRGLLFLRAADGSDFAPLGLRFGKRQGSLSAVPVIPILTSGAVGKMYWTDAGTRKIQRANLDGTEVEDLFASEVVVPAGLALDSGRDKLYWTDPGTKSIRRANLDETGLEDLVTGLREPVGLALDLDRGKMYWTDWRTKKIQRANLDGTSIDDLVTLSGNSQPISLALDGGRYKMYWTTGNSRMIQRANLDGTQVEDVVSGITAFALALDLGRDKLYWTTDNSSMIQRANLDGTQMENVVTGIDAFALALDLGRDKLYWAGADDETVKIQRANLDGTEVEDLVTSGLVRPLGFALDLDKQDGDESLLPTVTLTPSPAAIERGRSATLTWSSTNAVSATLTPGIGTVPTSGSTTVSPTTTTTYRITVRDAGGRTATSSATITVTGGDRNALMALYNSAGGSGWTRSDNWGTDAPLNDWYGVETDRNSQVIELNLAGNGLTGTIPPELGNLAGLTELVLQENNLSGPIPSAFGGLGNLEALSLVENNLTGAIPAELGSLANLTSLGLGSNALTGPIPREIGNLAKLERLVLMGNQLSGSIPSEIGGLANLAELLLGYNDLTGPIPPELGGLANLTVAALNNNSLVGPIPLEIGNLSQLEGLYLHDNLLTGPVPDSFLGLDQLEVLSIARNKSLCIPATQAFFSWLGGLEYEAQFCQGEDRAALVALYEATGGANWTDNENWLTDLPLVEWSGVATDSLGRVAGLFLEDNNLVGSIPPELGDLSHLSLLVLANNQLTKQIPDTFLRLEQLEQFYYMANAGLCAPNTNAFTSWLSERESYGPRCGQQADYAVLLALYDSAGGANWTDNTNWLTAAPIGDWYGVTTEGSGRVVGVRLQRNNLSGPVPTKLGDLAGLTHLDLNNNDLTGPIPPEFDNLTRLTHLDVWNNSLTGTIPPQLGNLASLTFLGLTGNNLTGPIPSELGTLTRLTRLYLWENRLSGPVPDSFLQLRRLESFFADSRNCVPASAAFRAWLQGINGHQATFCNAADRAALVELYKATDGDNWTNSDNWLTDAPLAKWRGVSTDAVGRVVRLSLRSNNLSGPIPPELANLDNLTHLDLSRNRLTGEIPPDLGRLAELDHLNLSRNSLTGTIPSDLGNLANLHSLQLANNDLSGPIPSQLGNLANLQSLRLGNNDLSGPIPSQLGNLASLTFLDLHHNDLRGRIPDSFLRLQRLEYVALDSRNCVPTNAAFNQWLQRIKQHGTTLCSAADRAALVELYMATDGDKWTRKDNWLTDAPLGDWYGVTTDSQGRVTRLSLEGNNLVGTIPFALGDLHASLTHLYLTGNALHGKIPPDLGRLVYLEVMSLKGNSLSGPIPEELGELYQLRTLYLSDNRLTGTIPPDFLYLCNLSLRELYLDGNKLHGNLPSSFAPCTEQLRVLHLHGNDFEGPFPLWLASLKNLTYLTLEARAKPACRRTAASGLGCVTSTSAERWLKPTLPPGAARASGTPGASSRRPLAGAGLRSGRFLLTESTGSPCYSAFSWGWKATRAAESGRSRVRA